MDCAPKTHAKEENKWNLENTVRETRRQRTSNAFDGIDKWPQTSTDSKRQQLKLIPDVYKKITSSIYGLLFFQALMVPMKIQASNLFGPRIKLIEVTQWRCYICVTCKLLRKILNSNPLFWNETIHHN